jgi:hypothetical protein
MHKCNNTLQNNIDPSECRNIRCNQCGTSTHVSTREVYIHSSPVVTLMLPVSQLICQFYRPPRCKKRPRFYKIFFAPFGSPRSIKSTFRTILAQFRPFYYRNTLSTNRNVISPGTLMENFNGGILKPIIFNSALRFFMSPDIKHMSCYFYAGP